MRIIFLSPHSDPQAKLGEPDAGGQCIYEHELSLALAKQGVEVLVFCRQRNHHAAISHVTRGYTIYRLTAGGEKFIPKEEIWRLLPEFTYGVASILKNKKPVAQTVIHAHYWDGVAAALYLKANFIELPLIWTPHSLGFVKREKYRGLANELFYHFIPRIMWESYGALAANRLLTLSRNEKNKLVSYYGADPDRIAVIPPGIAPKASQSADKYLRRWHLSPGTKILLTIGRMSRNKGYHHAIWVADLLRTLYPGKYALIIVGGSSRIASSESEHYQRRLRLLTQKLKLEDRVFFQPSVPHDQIQALYSLADLYLMTSEEEPFGMTVVEAMAAGKTVIAHNRGGTRDILVNGQTGFLTDIHNYRQVAELIAKLFKRRSRLERIGERAQAAVLAKYSWEQRLPAYLDIYRSVSLFQPTRLKKILGADRLLTSVLKIT